MGKIIAVVITALLISFAQSAPQAKEVYPLRLHPEFDLLAKDFDADAYLRNERLLNFQVNCLMDEGPCDIIGKFMKPRIARALLGDCIMCTPIQRELLVKHVEGFQTNRPALYRRLVVKYLEKAGIEVDDDKKTEIFEDEKLEQATKKTYVQGTLKLEDISNEGTRINATTSSS